MKKFLKLIICLLLFYFVMNNYNEIMKYIMINVIYNDKLDFNEYNEYSKKENWHYIQITNNFEPKNKQDLINIIYTSLDRGYDEITFYCDFNYAECIEDITDLINSPENKLSYIDSFLPTYNTYGYIESNINYLGRINLKVKKIYNESQINEINNKINKIYPTIINENMTDYEKIKAAHNYIVNNTSYDEEAAKKVKENEIDAKNISTSSTAYGPLILGKAICDGYTDAMALFLDKMNIKNFKAVSSNHMWNVIYLDGKWLHLDVTWDDILLENGKQILSYEYFLITTEELKNKGDSSHVFNQNIYDEIKS